MKKSFYEKMYFPFTICLIGILSYIMAVKLQQIDWSDISVHVNFARDLFQGNLNEISAYPAFHLLYGLFRCFTHTGVAAAAFSYAFFSMLSAAAVYFISGMFFKSLSVFNEKLQCAVTLLITMFGPIVFPGNGVPYYLGQGSFNAWHSPTNNAVKFAALLSFFAFSYLHGNNGADFVIAKKKINLKGQLIFLSAITFISLLCKPSFCQVFLPAVAIIILCDLVNKRITFKNAFLEVLAFVPAGLFLLWQFLKVFFISAAPDAGGGIMFQPFLVWSEYSGNIVVSILRAAAFPLFVFFFCYAGNKNKKPCLKYALIFYAVSVAEYALLAESGERMSDGNFQWGMNLAIGIFFLSALFEFISWNISTFNGNEDKAHIIKRVISFFGCLLLSLHFLFGTWYYIELMVTENIQYF